MEKWSTILNLNTEESVTILQSSLLIILPRITRQAANLLLPGLPETTSVYYLFGSILLLVTHYRVSLLGRLITLGPKPKRCWQAAVSWCSWKIVEPMVIKLYFASDY